MLWHLTLYQQVNPLRSQWEEEWTIIMSNKLREVSFHSALEYIHTYHLSRKSGSYLLRIGHSMIIHRFCMEQRNPLQCLFFQGVITISHILIGSDVLRVVEYLFYYNLI